MSVFDLVIREGTAATASVSQISPLHCADPTGKRAAKVVRHISCKANGVQTAAVLFAASVKRRTRRSLPIRRSDRGPAAMPFLD
jgi:hypothetical protein